MTKQANNLINLYDLRNKQQSVTDFFNQTLNKTLRMFEYEDLPLPVIQFEKQLQVNGYTVVFEHNDMLYCNAASLAGAEKSAYGEPTQALVNIPALQLSKTFELGKDAVLIKNDFLMTGLKPIILSKGTQIIENRLTMYIKNVLSRTPFTITASSDKSILSAQTFVNRLIDGELAVIGEDNFLKDVDVSSLNQAQGSFMQDLINYQTYLYGQLYNELGLPSLTFEKSERMNEKEIDSQTATIRPLVDNMLECRQKGLDEMNKLFNGNSKIELGSVWNNLKDENEQETKPKDEDGNGEADEVNEANEANEANEVNEDKVTKDDSKLD